MRKFRIMVILVVLAMGVSFTIQAQNDDDDSGCPTIVDAALEATNNVCEETGVNQICYGNTRIEIETVHGATDFRFEEVGDIVDLGIVRALYSSPMDIDANVWGVSLMRLQARMENTIPGQTITFLLFGHTEMRTAAGETVIMRATAPGGINLRSGPSTDYAVVGGLNAGDVVDVTGRFEDDSWLRIVHPSDATRLAWVYTSLVDLDGDYNDLALVTSEDITSVPGGLDSFYFRTGIGNAKCDEAPNSGVLVRTPEGIGEVTFNINEINIKLGSVAFIQADEEFSLSVLESGGRAEVSAFGETTSIRSNMRVRVPLDADGVASGPPGPPEMCNASDLDGLPASVNGCEVVAVVLDSDCPVVVPYGMDIQIGSGFGYPTESEARESYEQAQANSSVQIVINGDIVTNHAGDFGFVPYHDVWSYGVNYLWEDPEPGEHIVLGPGPHGSHIGLGETRTCEITVLEPND